MSGTRRRRRSSSARRPRRWVWLPRRPAGGRSLSAARCCTGAVRAPGQPPQQTEASMSGQLALVMGGEAIAAAAVWETLPPEAQRQVTLKLAMLLARLVE